MTVVLAVFLIIGLSFLFTAGLRAGVAVDDKSLKLRTVIGVQIQANVIASHSPTMTHLNLTGNPMSDGEH